MDGAAPDTTVRPLRAEDYAAVRAIAAAVAGGDRDPPRQSPAAENARLAVSPGAFAALVDGGCCWIAEAAGEPVGYLLAQPISYVEAAPLTVWVDEVAVHPDRRRRGVARALYAALGAWGRAAGVKAALTRVPPGDLAAWALHRRVGFEPHATGAIVWRFVADPAASVGRADAAEPNARQSGNDGTGSLRMDAGRVRRRTRPGERGPIPGAAPERGATRALSRRWRCRRPSSGSRPRRFQPSPPRRRSPPPWSPHARRSAAARSGGWRCSGRRECPAST